jgi:hypothetical protein
MRLLSICSAIIVLAFVNLMPSVAIAQCRHHHHHHHHHHHFLYCHRHYRGMSSVYYSACTCHFGYGDICAPEVSCYAEGGRCAAWCVYRPETEYLSVPETAKHKH